MKALRDYQQEIYKNLRLALRKHRTILVQLATGGGKTAIISEIMSSVLDKDKIGWFITPRKELLGQASKHFRKWGVNHNLIAPGCNESLAYNIHVISKDTLVRRWDKIKRWPDIILIDECHINYAFQIELEKRAPKTTIIIGWTATPERLSGEPLSKEKGGIYEIMIKGPSIPWLMERGFLTPLRYFSPPLDGLQDIKTNRTGEYDEETLEELLKRRKVYGQVVDHYAKHSEGRAALIFCRSVKSAYQTAERFRDRGFNFQCIEGLQTDTERERLVRGLTTGEIQGLCGVDIFAYGLDIPRVEYGASVRPTESLSLYMQMIGRILRPYTDPVTGYVKQDAMFFDHVNLITSHQDPANPGVPLHYVPDITWNFDGTEKRKKSKTTFSPVACPHLDFMYCPKPHCTTCQYNPDKSVTDARRPLDIVPAELTEIKKPVSLNQRPPEERREIQDQIGAAVLEYKTNPGPLVVEKLLKIADDLGYQPLWVYHRLTEESRYTVNVPLLHEIARLKGYAPGWVFFTTKKIKSGKMSEKKYQEVMV